jgi:hypothetical protein
VKTGPIPHPIAYKLPEGVDADLYLYFVSDKTGMECRVAVAGVTMFASPDNLALEARKSLEEPQMRDYANDWRFMSRAEVLDYRKRLREAANADQDNQTS